MKDADARGKNWKSYSKLKQAIELLGGKQFRDTTHDFRNAYNHRFSPRLVIGITGPVKRRTDETTGHIVYDLGGVWPSTLELSTEALTSERDRACRAFKAFQILVHEQTAAIARI